ncbi:hypothetical protein A3C89_00660 [Candidatus Kaiserbacteria bacterium RIFCSPHIGHO2_02_FULL_50_50]|uniref:DUF5666 domain-containing protein n=1 Tax=Candidatus Kaiserbacteria bacterium RIFCSPHIGHO2_02_FULL_50_50 TaxID=1798492 RepID=A0A1F6DG16_9BACT|nr:MAG: hypothetical protein A3C89_00660 [Candidatus Kaiserbacteria bacterium RIFCSPHIGHO2_02_FULL_50_50]OGG88863.1 MAG: hypothetical protein A3G62_03100 [Candidatus Kaiserbacteria bacterium RIFCSPLOWO2_12_FULL_50_10]
MNKAKYIILPALVGTMVLGSAGTALAAQEGQDNGQGKGRGQEMRLEKQEGGERGRSDEGRPMDRIIGEITALSGTTLTLTIKGPEDESKTLTVDASSATFEKITFDGTMATGTRPTPVTQTISDLAVGEKVAVRIDDDEDVDEDTTSVVATVVTELSGDMPERPVMMGGERPASSTKQMMDPGKRGIVGEVTDMDGDTLTVKAMNGTTYTVTASDAEVKNRTTTETLSDIAEGDRIAVRGEITDTTIDATMILTDIPAAPADKNADDKGKERSFFGKVGSFFGKLFGKKAE